MSGRPAALRGAVDLDPDDRRMARCAELAGPAHQVGNAAVGAVVVRTGSDTGIAEGRETTAGIGDLTGHAEINALREAVAASGTTDLSDCTLYTTTEPYFMCPYRIRESHLRRVVIGRAFADIGGVKGAGNHYVHLP
ncbi:MAG: nucleoside deaminase [Cytophagales bacterium]|nr:nucleoside deaminase [Armatimonadota bacterium]